MKRNILVGTAVVLIFGIPDALGQISSYSPKPGGAWQPGWAKWQQEAALLNVTVLSTGKVDVGVPFTVTAGNLSATNLGAGCLVATNLPELDVIVKLFQPVIVRAFGSNLSSINIELLSPDDRQIKAAVNYNDPLRRSDSRRNGSRANLNLQSLGLGSGEMNGAANSDNVVHGAGYQSDLDRAIGNAHREAARRASKSQPKMPGKYRVYVDGVETNRIEFTTNTCSFQDRSWVVELRPDKQSLYRNPLGRASEYDVPDTEAPGDGQWPEIGPGKSEFARVTAIKCSVGLGRLLNGKSAGRIFYVENELTSNSYAPNAIFFYQPFTNHTQVTVITNHSITNSYVIRQIRAPQAFVDIPATNTNSFELRFYLPGQISATTNASGYYDILTNSPFVVWRFGNPDENPTITRRLRISEERLAITYTNDIEFDSTNNIWSLTRGVGPEQYRETRRIAFEINDVLDEFGLPIGYSTNRFETNRVTDGASRLAYEAIEKHRWFEWGWDQISVTVDPATNALTTTFEYFTSTNAESYRAVGELHRTSYPDGSWEHRRYGSPQGIGQVLQYIHRPYKDSPATADPNEAFAFYYLHDRVSAIWPPYLRSTSRGFATNVTGYVFRYDTTKHRYASATSIRETVQIGGVPDCMLAKVRDGTIRYMENGSAARFGHVAFSLLNYQNAVTNTFEFGVWSNAVFYPGAGDDWCKTSITGWGSLFDEEASSFDWISLTNRNSTKLSEIRKTGVPVCTEFYIYTDTSTNGTNFSLVFQIFSTNDVLGHAIARTRLDSGSSAQRPLYSADWQGTNQFPTSLLLSETSEDGLTMRYSYDSLKRLKSSTLVGTNGLPDYVVTFNYDPCGRVLSVLTNAGSLSLSNQFVYDGAGRLTKSTDAAGLETTYSYLSGGLHTSIAYPGGATYVRSNFLSGELKSETGTSIVPKYYDFTYFPEYFIQTDVLAQKHRTAIVRSTRLSAGTGSTNDDRITYTHYNMWDSVIQEEVPKPAGGHISKFYFFANYDENSTCIQLPSHHGDLPLENHIAYDVENHPYASWLYVTNGGGSRGLYVEKLPPTPASTDRLTQTFVAYTNIDGSWFRVTNVFTYLTDASASATQISETRVRLNGFPSGVASEVTIIDVNSNAVIETVYVDRAAKKVTTVLTNAVSVLRASNVVVNGLLQSESTLTVAKPTTYTHDALRRPIQIASPVGAVTKTTYDTATGWLSASTDFAGNTTSYEYYPGSHPNAGKIKCVTGANGKKTYYEYNLRGQLVHTWGDVPYPEERIYNVFGDLTELRTYRAGSGWTGSVWPTNTTGTSDKTFWNYESSSGYLTSKVDNAGQAVLYTYHVNGLLDRRQWARGVITTNIYTAQADQYRLDYSDGTPSVLFTNYNRLGQPRTILDAAGERSLIYDHAGQLMADVGVSGLFTNLTVTNGFHSIYGKDRIGILGSNWTRYSSFGYDNYGRMGSATYSNFNAQFAYLANSDRLQTTTYRSNSTSILTTTRIWEFGERLQSIANVLNNAEVTAHRYLYDSEHRRTHATLEDGSIWRYNYNDRNEVISGKRYWNDWTPAAGQQFEYNFDTVGNRTSTKAGGDNVGQGLRPASYSPNGLNQYTSRGVPEKVDVVGAAKATASVTVNGGAAYERGEYFRCEPAVTNGSGPSHTTFITTAVEGTNSLSHTGAVLVPPATQNFQYDPDGNLTNDSVWSYKWDGENRLAEMEGLSSVPSSVRRKLLFSYDFLGRRVRKQVLFWNGVTWLGWTDVKFFYDGWNLLMEMSQTNSSLFRTYVWGPDLSGNTDGAGGIGGLVMVITTSTGCQFPAYDGNGNVSGYVDGLTRSVSARYEYGPFGELIRQTGDFKDIPFRWSTKYCDDDSGLVGYSKRFYNAAVGRWTSRDPDDENGGLNLYAFVENQALTAVDALGLSKYYPGGHHVGTMQLAKSLPEGPGKEFLKTFTIPVLKPHGWNKAHMLYNDAVADHFARWLAARNLTPADFAKSEALARELIDDVMNQPSNSTIGAWLKGNVNGAKALKAFTILGAAFAGYSAYAGSGGLIDSLQSYQRSAAAGDVAATDLDAISAAIAVQDMTGDYFTTMYVLDFLLD